jgi:class III poly(R)-hydroxyalkanoic acid synthase PhaE subunit
MSEDWLQLQRNYWEQWTDLSRKALGMDQPKPAAWEGALDHWWQAMAPAAPDMAREFMEKLIEQGKMFFRMADTFTRELPGNGSSAEAWDAVTKIVTDMQKTFAGMNGQGEEALHKMLAFWELPYDNWQRMMSSLSPLPGDLLRNMPREQVKESIKRLLSAPGLGYTREEQSHYQDLMRRTLAYQQALQDYFGFFSHLGVKSAERMRRTLETIGTKDIKIDSARALYDSWVSCCEEVYAEEVRTPEYARIHGHLVNAQMALKRRMSIMVDEALGAMNMPTRSELRTLQERLQETRRESKMLHREIELLKREVHALTHGAGSTHPPATNPPQKVAQTTKVSPTPPRKKAVVRKKTTGPSASK